MKSENFSKLYAVMTPKELAVLAFNHIGATDNSEVTRIERAVPRRTYQIADHEFRLWSFSIGSLSQVFGLWHWQYRFQVMEAAHALRFPEPVPEGLDAESILGRIKDAESLLLALDRVLDELCAEHGIDPSKVRSSSSAEPYQPVTETEAKVEHIEFLRGHLRALLPTDDRNTH
ncbi:MAG: hypothetical protein ACYDBH_19455 [Acidobacteriaceae bacterium]